MQTLAEFDVELVELEGPGTNVVEMQLRFSGVDGRDAQIADVMVYIREARCLRDALNRAIAEFESAAESRRHRELLEALRGRGG